MSSSKRQEIEQRLRELEIERADLLYKLTAEPADPAVNLVAHQALGTPVCITPPATSEERIALFTRLFRCREDVFPKRWENKAKNTNGYSPACRVEWFSGVCEKPGVACSKCRHSEFVPLDESVIRNHLEGTFTIGTYAIRKDDTCVFLAADFGKEHWQQDVTAFRETAESFGVETYVERSRSGNGAHAWVFFKEPVLAKLARQFGTILLINAIGTRYHHVS